MMLCQGSWLNDGSCISLVIAPYSRTVILAKAGIQRWMEPTLLLKSPTKLIQALNDGTVREVQNSVC